MWLDERRCCFWGGALGRDRFAREVRMHVFTVRYVDN